MRLDPSRSWTQRQGMDGPAAPDVRDAPSATLLAIVFTAVVGSFLLATVLTLWASEEVDSLSDTIISDSMPSVVRLASLRGEVFEVELALRRSIADVAAGRPPRDERLGSALTHLESNPPAHAL